MNKKNSWLDAYEIKARLIAAALCAVPGVVLYHYLLQAHFSGLLTDLGHVRLLGYLTIEASATYAIMQLNNRLVGRLLQDKIFQGGRMPTTQLLMPDDPTLSLQTKRDIAKKFKKDFKKDLPLFDPGMTESERRQRISELMVHIRHATRSDLLVKNHNIEYGFVRNLCGGAFAAAVISAISATIFGLVAWNKGAFAVSLCLLAIYGLLAIASSTLIRYFGVTYARVLLEQYLCD